MRTVLDTNVVISAVLWGGLPGRLFFAARDERFVILVTDALLNELRTTLSRDKFAVQLTKHQLSVDSVINQYQSAAVVVEPAEVPFTVVRDPKDRLVLACAVGGNADFIVSGDKDLLVLSSYEGIPILNAEQFLERLSTE